jgi:hypothetical protein
VAKEFTEDQKTLRGLKTYFVRASVMDLPTEKEWFAKLAALDSNQKRKQACIAPVVVPTLVEPD